METQEIILRSGKKLAVAELNGWQSFQADEMVGFDATPMRIGKMYALFGIRAIDGEEVRAPKSNVDVQKLAGRFTVGELLELSDEYSTRFLSAPIPDEVKNE